MKKKTKIIILSSIDVVTAYVGFICFELLFKNNKDLGVPFKFFIISFFMLLSAIIRKQLSKNSTKKTKKAPLGWCISWVVALVISLPLYDNELTEVYYSIPLLLLLLCMSWWWILMLNAAISIYRTLTEKEDDGA